MQKQKLIEIGNITKPHGVKGDVVISLNSSALIENIKELVFIEIDGLPVPFFISSITPLNNNRYKVKFDWIDSEQKAKNICNKNILLNSDSININDDIENYLTVLKGFTVTDTSLGEIGIIDDIDTSTDNTLMIIHSSDNKELLIPLQEELIRGINTDSSSITITIPEGLLDI